MGLGRRQFFATSASAALLATLASLATRKTASARGPWGPPLTDPDEILDLPDGFSYRILEDAGQTMTDGYQMPGRPDGMACFAGPNNTLILMRNHENSAGAAADGPYQDGQPIPPEAYDPEGMGGVTRVVVDATTYERISSNLVLIGSVRNCAGGPSPWGWLSCEENTEINGEVRHGYTFLCPIDAETVQPPQRIDGYGRYNHEAVAIDPSNHYAYLTEDRLDSCLYRFAPDEMDAPFVGRLQALKVVGQDGFNTGTMVTGEVVDVEWIDIDLPDPDTDVVRDEAQSKGAAIIVRGEGIAFFEGQIYICATAGGALTRGQILRLIDGDSPTLEVVVASTDTEVLDMPDNITVAPWGDVFMAEDGARDQYIRYIDRSGQVCDFARNASSGSEMAGVCFSPDGGALFVNLQTNGLTLVITGPFPGFEPMGDGDGDNETESGEGDTEGEGEESGETGDETGTGGALSVDDSDGGCGCSSNSDDDSGVAVVLSVAAIAGVATLTRDR